MTIVLHTVGEILRDPKTGVQCIDQENHPMSMVIDSQLIAMQKEGDEQEPKAILMVLGRTFIIRESFHDVVNLLQANAIEAAK